MADIILKDEYGKDVVYEGVEEVTFKTADGSTVTFSLGGGTIQITDGWELLVDAADPYTVMIDGEASVINFIDS